MPHRPLKLIALCVQRATAAAEEGTAAAAPGTAAVARTARKNTDAAAAGEDQQPAEGPATVRHSLTAGELHSGSKHRQAEAWAAGGCPGDPPRPARLDSTPNAVSRALSGSVTGLQAAKAGRRKRGPLEALQENASVDATPAPRGKSHAVPFTPAAAPTVLRAPRLGEVFYSQTGPPL